MSSLFEDPDPGAGDTGSPAGDNAPEFTVSELSGAVKRVIEGEFARVRVRGEVGRVSRPRSGHVYLDLKDDRSTLAGIIWKGQAARLSTFPEEGLEVIATGRMTTFPGQSKYQIIIDDIRPAGIGALMALLEKRKAALEAEGLFDASRKRPLPFLPRVIGVVTSPSGAVIRDILHRLSDRFPRRVIIWPVAVQGQACAPAVARAIRGFNALAPDGPIPRPDLLIVARGGGSVEDLWGFNEEIVARAAAESTIPLISAVGHETDTTLIDHVSDRRAPTPSAAAEMAVPVRAELVAAVDARASRLRAWGEAGRGGLRQRLGDLSRALPRPESLLDRSRQKVLHLAQRLPAALRSEVQVKRARYGHAAAAIRGPMMRARVEAGQERVRPLALRLAAAIGRLGSRRSEAVQDRAGRLAPAFGRVVRAEALRIAERRGAVAALAERLAAGLRRQRDDKARALGATDKLRRTLGPDETLARGFAIAWGPNGVVTTAAQAKTDGIVDVQFKDGRIAPKGGERGAPPRMPARRKPPPDQGTLF